MVVLEAGKSSQNRVLIVGAGPAGLALALELLPLLPPGQTLTLVEQSAQATLADPPFDGREIALTLYSVATLQRLGAWAHLPAEAISPLKDARVMDGADPFAMVISHRDAPPRAREGVPAQLGFLVGNHHIRRALYRALQEAMAAHPGRCILEAGQCVQAAACHADGAAVRLRDGRVLAADLLVAADSRHSSTRRALGLAADVHDFGRSMLLCAMTHEHPHHHTAWEWFDYGQTLALLPMNDCPRTGRPRSSVVLTLPGSEVDAVLQLDEEAFNAHMQRRFASRLGRMAQASSRHVYPLVAVYPRRLVGPRLACVGDAACGMHPVTAHGFNLGLRSTEALARTLRKGLAQGRGWADAAVLARYEREHWLASRPLYLATQWIAQLYTNEAPLVRPLRLALLRLGEGLAPFRRAVAASLTGA